MFESQFNFKVYLILGAVRASSSDSSDGGDSDSDSSEAMTTADPTTAAATTAAATTTAAQATTTTNPCGISLVLFLPQHTKLAKSMRIDK